MARNLLQQEPGRENRRATAAGIPNVSYRNTKRHKEGTPKTGDPFRVVVKGRDRWTLEELRKAGFDGITSYTNPAPCISAYIHNLRARGVEIETITEPHDGDFAGYHGRYVLRSGVTPDREGAQHD